MASRKEHSERGPKEIGFYVVTISSSRYRKMVNKEPIVDESGDLIKQLVIESGHKVVGYSLVPDSKVKILRALLDALEGEGVDVVVTSGGTGYSPTDLTYEVVRSIFDKEIIGFSDVFRSVSYSDPDVRAAAYLTRATAGIVEGKIVYALPGSPQAVKLAMRELVLPEVGHLLGLLKT
ncbi:molybdenum cofactor biosynthesis protein [Sulfodiicoccus acidiphilus]|uniref:Molybdenum cofactor biosynthesis protein n=1 Tax=Sulfodiicoccus acidiphilus TaxID=1670455 RepID=A0A348B3R8_9CREN|nr:molybdenum cofactor biosynthesis protein B [Sulfodiicoccus acidiphilus]BBD72820.1 molybdenum cofactor biosynthesis protein [Sulfodiicoccus acidiphilus]GGU04230.1 molybdenum cofactor biosynthesis protein [Sulfodiicoccus acidiphilus]